MRKTVHILAGILIAIGAVAGLTGAMMLHANAKREQRYFADIEAASAQESISDAQKYFLEAFETDSGRSEAYEALMNKIEEDILANGGSFTAEAAGVLRYCLIVSSNGYSPNQEVLKKADPGTFADVMYEAGIWQFFLRGNTEADKKNAADNYFSKLQDEGIADFLTDDERELSRILFRIGGYMSSLNSSMARYGRDKDNSAGYRELFKDLKALTDVVLRATAVKDIYRIEICGQIAYWLDIDKDRFLKDEVSPGDIYLLLKEIKKELVQMDISKSSDIYEVYEAALETADAALLGMDDISA